jgi:UDP-GlcNAc:undecaprenyl-phosphate/decaprenyl-phosphate GlcNAc-1-phosphate transferase
MNQTTLPLAAALIGGAISLFGTWATCRVSRRIGFVDHPGGHKGHAGPIALGGGVAIAAAVAVPMLAAVILARFGGAGLLPEAARIHLGGIVSKTPLALGIIAGIVITCGMGLWDDRRPLRPLPKLMVQMIVAAGLVLVYDLRLLSHLGWTVSSALSILWILTLMNSLNFLDNMDGLAAGVAMIASSVFAFAALADGQFFVPACCMLLAGALAGFLPFNFFPAKIFMGDAGSQVIGMLLGVFTILTTFADPARGQKPIGALAPLVVMAVPLYDTVSVVFLRMRMHVSIWTGDRRHISHRLINRGMSVPRAVLIIWLATLVTALPALLLATASWTLAWCIAGETIFVVSVVAFLEWTGSKQPRMER